MTTGFLGVWVIQIIIARENIIVSTTGEKNLKTKQSSPSGLKRGTYRKKVINGETESRSKPARFTHVTSPIDVRETMHVKGALCE